MQQVKHGSMACVVLACSSVCIADGDRATIKIDPNCDLVVLHHGQSQPHALGITAARALLAGQVDRHKVARRVAPAGNTSSERCT
jgi:hypothetical protein